MKQFSKSLETYALQHFSEDQWIWIEPNVILMLFWKQKPGAHPSASVLAEGLPLSIMVIGAKEIFQT